MQRPTTRSSTASPTDLAARPMKDRVIHPAMAPSSSASATGADQYRLPSHSAAAVGLHLAVPSTRARPSIDASPAITSVRLVGITTLVATAALAAMLLAASTERAGAQTRDEMKTVVASVEAATGKTVGTLPNGDPGKDDYCLNDDYCQGFIGELSIEVMGQRVDVMPSPRTPAEILEGVCVGVLRAFDDELRAAKAREIVRLGISRVVTGTDFEIQSDTLKFSMKPTGEDLPGCTLVRFVQR